MKIALLGFGKTGSKIMEVTAHPVEVFDTKHVPTYEKLKNFDVIISFLPGEAFKQYLPMLVETRVPVVTGSTGLAWPENFDQTLKDKNLPWIYATNFSLGVVIVKQMLEKLSRASHLFKNSQASIHEIHHTRKLDAPSGTALSMHEWYGKDCTITSERTGDVVGHHTFTLNSGSEKITLTHEALDRKLFAEGAVWAAENIKDLQPGLHSFQKIVEERCL